MILNEEVVLELFRLVMESSLMMIVVSLDKVF